MRSVLILALTALGACTARGPGADRPQDGVTRVAGEPRVVQRLAPDASGSWRLGPPLPCSGLRCLVSRVDVVGVLDGDTIWVRTADDVEGRTMPLSPAPGGTDEEPVAWARAAAAGLAAEDSPGSAATAAAPVRPPPPKLSAEFRTCGAISGGGGFGYHVVRNDGSVWQRVAWVVPPTAPDMVGLPADAYPIVDSDGVVCGFGEQRRGERRWTVHHRGSGVTVEAIPDREHVPATCGRDGVVHVETATGPVHVAADGTIGTGQPVLRRTTQAGLDAKTTHHIRTGIVPLVRPGGDTVDLQFIDGAALDGTPVPAGMLRDRVIVVGDGTGHVAVVERFTGPISGLELLQVLRVDTETPAVVAVPVRGDVIISRVAFALGALWWVEAPAVAVRLSE